MGIKTTRRQLLVSGMTVGMALPFMRTGTALAAGRAANGPSAEQFLDPPQSARPHVWWHWMNGNVSAEGAKLDLEWMQRIGIGGVHAFSGGGLPAPAVVTPPVPFMSGPWQEVMRQSLDQARGAGLEFGIAGSPGWHVTGGPWVSPGDGMKKYVWSEERVEGGKPYRGKLPAPPRVTGPFQSRPGGKSKASAYGDVAVIAFPTPRLEQALPPAHWLGGEGPIDLALISGTDLGNKGVKLLPLKGEGRTWLEASFDRPVMIGALTLSIEDGARIRIEAEASSGQFQTFASTEIRPAKDADENPAPQQTVAFAPITARRFRVHFEQLPAEPATPLTAIRPPAAPNGFTLTQLRWVGGARINGFEAKAGFAPTLGLGAAASPPAPQGSAIERARVVDLTDRLGPDGTLDWSPPRGDWTVLRFGWSLTGVVNGPAEASATGLEVDKFDGDAVRRYLRHYLGLYTQATGREPGPGGIQTLLTDSWESRVQNWTPALLSEFRNRRGYDALHLLPVLAGRVVDSSDVSERFLHDFRQTLKDLLADCHYGVLAAELKARGMGYYSEALGDNARAIGDGMTIKARSDIPTAEYWYRAFATVEGQPPLKADLEEAASAAHVYGKPLVAAEALTVAALNDAWAFSPAMLKPVADEIFARGVNRILLHESHHQPLPDRKPGLQLFLWGQYFNRNDTWAEHAGPWVKYLARTSHMLQQGSFVADIAYFYGEERNLTELFLHGFNTDVPSGYKYDYVNPEALLTLLSVRSGRIVTPSGMSYAVLFMPGHVRRLTLPALRKLRELVMAGAVLVGSRPTGGLGLLSPDADVKRIADELWGDGSASVRQIGKGRIYSGLAEALAAERIEADVTFDGEGSGELLYLHRQTPGADIYFISNQDRKAATVRGRFRVSGRAPDIWRADTGEIEAASYEQVGGAVEVELSFDPHEAFFVVFRRSAPIRSWLAPAAVEVPLASLAGPWKVSFAPGLGAPAEAVFDKLISWPDSDDAGIRYFSGAATYRQTLSVQRSWLKPGRRLELDLGDVRELAAVSLNGVTVGTAWKPPYRLDITEALKPGRNLLEIEVVNLWPNRLIGDRQAGSKPVAYAPDARYGAGAALLPSGLLGPVRIHALDMEASAPPRQGQES